MHFLYICFGLIGLWLGTKWIIQAALGIATKYKLSHAFVGVAILAVGTDLPEIFVSVNASLKQLAGVDSSGIITGNAIGSCISQILLILGIAGLFLKFNINRVDFTRDALGILGSLLILYFFSLDGTINRIEGSVMIGLYIAYYLILVKTSKSIEQEEKTTQQSSIKLIIFLLLGLVILVFASHIVVENAMSIAEQFGIAQSFVGIAIIGIGTSLPELAVSIGAALKKSADMSVGNIIGSNIFDGLIPIGLSGLISTTRIDSNLREFDLPYLFFASLLVMLFLRTKRGISKPEGIVLILLFISYLVLKLYRF